MLKDILVLNNMKYKVFKMDDKENILMSKKELEELLEDVYNDGYSRGKDDAIHTQPIVVNPITTPTYPWYWSKTEITCNDTAMSTTGTMLTYGSDDCVTLNSDPLPASFNSTKTCAW